MDEMSDADRNSEPDVEDEFGMKNEEMYPGNDTGAEDGAGLGTVKIERDEGILESEQTSRWGVVLVQGDALEGGLRARRYGQGTDDDGL